MDLDTLIREADPARRVTIPQADPADARQIRSRSQRSLGDMVGVLWGAMAVTVALAVAVIALVVGGNRHGHQSAAPIPAAARPLTSILGVLRRPQTAADRAAESTIGKLRTPDAALVRLAAVTPWGQQLILAPLRGGASDVLGMFKVDARGTPGGGVSCGCGLTPALIEAGRGLSLEGAGRNFAGGSTGVRLFIVVPDGVAKVAFVLPRQPVPSSVPGGPTYRHPLVVSAPVHNNVAFVQVLNRECCDGNLVTRWYTADGRLIKTTGKPASSNRIVPTPTPTPATALSRAAARDPSTPNPVRVLPRSGGPHTIFRVRWRLLLTDADYTLSFTGPNAHGCSGANRLTETVGGGLNDVRGQLYGENVEGTNTTPLCRGSYHVSVTVHDLGSAGSPKQRVRHDATPFGTSSFAVKP